LSGSLYHHLPNDRHDSFAIDSIQLATGIIIPTCIDVSCTDRLWPLLLFSSCIVSFFMMKHSSSTAASLASSVSGTTTPPSSTSAELASCPSIDFDDYPHGPIIKVVLYHPSLLKVEADFPNIMCVQEVPHNHFFASKPPPTALGAELHPIPDFVKNWRELLLVPLICKSIHKICKVLQISNADTKVDLITGVLGQGATF